MKKLHISRKRAMPAGRQGFTLVELLIVIGILGILAAGLLATLDPIEQLRRGRDTNRRNSAVEVANAINRFYAVRGSFPWGTVVTYFDVTSATGTAMIGSLVTQNELKTGFLAGIPTGKALTYSSNTTQDIFACVGQEGQGENPAYIYTNAGGATGATCPSSTTGCFFCAR